MPRRDLRTQTAGDPVNMAERKEVSCSSPAAMCDWFVVFLMAWAVVSLIGMYWYPLHALSAATMLLAMAIGCAANWFKNRSLHCAITGAVFLIAALIFLLTRVNSSLVWPFVLILVCIAFLLEWRYAKRCDLQPATREHRRQSLWRTGGKPTV